MTHVDASLVQQIFDIPKRERETDVQHHCKADDFGTGFEVLEGCRIGHGQKLRNTPTPLNQSSSDKTSYLISTAYVGGGAVRRIRTRLYKDKIAVLYTAPS